jgi:curved DNA-binding protein CbpA
MAGPEAPSSDIDDLKDVRLLVAELHAALDSAPYHVFLGVDERAAGDDLRRAFHARAQLLHPDRFYDIDDDELRGRIYAVYKRITEAYRVLGDPTTRKKYEEQRARGGVRFDAVERAPALKRPEDAVSHPAAKKYFLLALDAERRGDQKSARLNLQLALQMDPGNSVLKERLEKLK